MERNASGAPGPRRRSIDISHTSHVERPLKIALVSAYDYAFRGGANEHIRNLAAQFEGWGHTIKVIAPCSKPEGIPETNFIPMGKAVPLPSAGSIARVSLSVWLRPRIQKLLRDEAFDIVHLHEPFSGFVTLYMAGHSETVNIATFHSYRGTRLYGIGANKLAMPLFRRLHGLIAVSKPAHDFISSHFPGDYRIIPNGIDVDAFAKDVEPFENLQDGMINLLFVGRLEKRKGLKYMLGAYSRLKWDWPNLRLVVVGPGKPDQDSHSILSERNLQDVMFVGGVSEEDKARYYRSADIYCSPATGRESFGIVLLEAMAAGKPIVATSIEGYSTVVTEGQEGLLVPPKDDEALADAISKLLKNPELREKMAANGRKTVDEYRWERVAGRVMAFYRLHLDDATTRAEIDLGVER
ncbi:MAG: glycosyltransferase family 4 protein [SAR202 cluster bacterium]|nr:glycosyltransferase family 4 protein [SAR202 cluster bacterium]